jgi:aerobic carbon-monoxide dehydrogenase medium subunit
MIPAAFGYTRANTVDEALAAIAADVEAKVIAGGQSILPLMKLRLAHPGPLVDIGRLPGLRGVSRLGDGRISIGALTTYAELMASPAMAFGVLKDALPTIGDVQVRNRGTVGGAVAHADPSSDLPAALLALGAELVLLSTRGTRTVPADGFFEGPFQTGLAHDELLTAVLLPPASDSAGSAYASLEQPASGYALVGVGACVVLGPGGLVERAGVGITGVSEHPHPATGVEAAIVGSDGSAGVLAAAAANAVGSRPVNGDIHAGPEYRAAMAVVYTRRALEAAIARAR